MTTTLEHCFYHFGSVLVFEAVDQFDSKKMCPWITKQTNVDKREPALHIFLLNVVLIWLTCWFSVWRSGSEITALMSGVRGAAAVTLNTHPTL